MQNWVEASQLPPDDCPGANVFDENFAKVAVIFGDGRVWEPSEGSSMSAPAPDAR